MKKNKVVIHLMGRDYALLTDQNPEKVQRTARYVDRKMRETAITTRAGESMVPTLTAMNLADELFRAQDENVRLKKELASRQKD
ncbi:MAG: cell division protein ZapA [Clostridia bacterium]|nr:cell division protein ZapA [Clostridia bacterium]MBQ4609608.1 cell division protein ZapA [Clostridia bacterium]MBQ6858804.1 cell division protein ZapA [Clostridia bacterium]MBQ7052156.1 cell division protein ZapA [Clostridia bacterium]